MNSADAEVQRPVLDGINWVDERQFLADTPNLPASLVCATLNATFYLLEFLPSFLKAPLARRLRLACRLHSTMTELKPLPELVLPFVKLTDLPLLHRHYPNHCS